VLSADRLHFLATVANLYYIEQKSQQAIARQFGYSRSAISRLLTEARQQGIVEIRIHHPLQRATDLEQALLQQFNLEDVFVVRRGNQPYSQILRLIGKQGAAYLNKRLHNDAILGISWGTAVYEVSNEIARRPQSNIKVVQMIGAIGYGNPVIDGVEVARSFANSLGSQHYTLNAPLIVENRQTKQALESERNIRETLQLALRADFALVGIGTVEPERASLVRAGYLSAAEMQAIKEDGAIGDICAAHYDINGRFLNIDINQRIIGVNMPALANSACNIIGVACGSMKAPAILGGLRGNLIDVLIIDSAAAKDVLQLSTHTLKENFNYA
jgi:DNA-binding transcriptional regulator LsrR (DeoR family)